MNDISHVNLFKDFEFLSLAELLGSESAIEFPLRIPHAPDDLIVRGMLHRAGRAGFYYWYDQNRERLDWDEVIFRHAPVKKKISLGLGKICEILSEYKHVTIQLLNLKDRWVIELDPQSKNPVSNCDYLAGFAQEFCAWAGLGKFYRVKIERAGENEPCRILLFKEPLDD